MDYHVVFDVSRNSSELHVWVFAPLLALLTGLIGWGLLNPKDENSNKKGKFFIGFSCLGLVFSLLLMIGNYAEYHAAQKELETGKFQMIEGIVTDFVPMPAGSHATESFRVGGIEFRYGGGWGSTHFNSNNNKGYVKNGAMVRISYVGGDILRLEVK